MGAGKAVTATGFAASAGNAGAAVYGYSVAGSSLTANLGVITPVPLSITANNASRPEFAPNPPFTATYDGLVGGDTPSNLTGALQFRTPATIDSPMGSYLITPFGQSSTNYTISYVDGALEIVKQSRPAESAAWARLSPQTIAASYSSLAPPTDEVPALRVRVASGGLNVNR